MDLRNPVVGILVGGSPAPGVNGVISAATLEAIHQSCTVVGFFEGFKKMKQGISLTTPLEEKDVTRIHREGGSILRTSKFQVGDEKEVDNCLRVLEMNRVRYLVTIGGTNTAFSATKVCAAAKRSKYKLSIVHVPKTIFNDLPLPEGARTFGFSTAREVGIELMHNLQMDARTMQRWYISVVMGQQAGHLALGIGKGSASTITLIPEDFKDRPDRKITFAMVCDMLESCIYKRKARGKEYGIAVVSEGLVDLMDKKEIEERWKDADQGHQDLGRHIVLELQSRFALKKIECTLVARNIGCECRAANPNADDLILTRDLGFGAVRFLMAGGSDSMITMNGDAIGAIPFDQIMDPKSGLTRIRYVDTRKVFYQVAQSYMFKLHEGDLKDKMELTALARAARMTPEEFIARFNHVAEPSTKHFLSPLDNLTTHKGAGTSSHHPTVIISPSGMLELGLQSPHEDHPDASPLHAQASAALVVGPAIRTSLSSNSLELQPRVVSASNARVETPTFADD